MSESNKFNIREICRGCLSDKRDNLRSLFDSDILDTFTLCTNIQVTEQDGDNGLPTLICSSCVYKSVSWFSFKTQCEQSDQILRNTLKCPRKSPKNVQIIVMTNEQSSSKIPPNLQVQNADVDNLLTVFEEPESSELKHQPKSVEPLCGIENNSEICKQSEFKEESETYDQYQLSIPSTDQNRLSIPSTDQDSAYEVEISDVEELIIDEIHESVVDELKQQQLSDAEPLEVDEKLLKTRNDSASTKPKQPFICNECGKNLRNSDRLLAHQRSVHQGKKPEVCPICDKEFNNLRALRRHRLKHTDTKQFRCNECGKMYKYQTSLTLHKKDHANVRRFVCDLCGKSFVRADSLTSHLLTHSTLTPFSCDYNSCGKQFKNKIMLRNHQRRHEGIKKFICSECGKEFMTSAELTTHTRSHTGLKPYVCTMCPKSYKTKSHLSVHYRSHSGSRPYSCDICQLKFAHNKVLKNHQLVHLGERPWSCDVCLRPFRQKSSLTKHKKTHKLGKNDPIWNDQTQTPGEP